MGSIEVNATTSAEGDVSHADMEVVNTDTGSTVDDPIAAQMPYTKSDIWVGYTYDVTVTAQGGFTGYSTDEKTKTFSPSSSTTSKTYNLTVQNYFPTADFQDSDNASTVETGTTVTLDASASTDPDGDSLTYAWDLDGDGNYDEATGETVTVSESSSGTYKYEVEVEDGNGGYDYATYTLTVNEPPTGTLEISGVTDSNGDSLSSFDYTVTRVSDGTEVASVTGASAPVTETVESQYDYDVSVSKSGYDSVTKTYTISENSTTSNSFTLSQISGSAEITVEDWNGDLLADGDATVGLWDGEQIASQSAGSDGVATFSDIPTGTYDVEITHPDRPDSFGTVTISENTTATKTIQFETPMKSFDIVVEDSSGSELDSFDYTVSQDGTAYTSGISENGAAVKLADIEYGTYTFEASSDGYETSTKTATVDEDKYEVVLTLSESTTDDTSGDGSDNTGGGSGSASSNNILVVIGVFVLVFVIIMLFLAVRDQEE
ncbi:PKD domain-containing protein [Haloarcula sp. CBA1130]|nr:PKD domain-containing protein [Haloarcula sp. CBA1129]KAA9401880.1 PKD domain-containing protein [Haloarcula sp. CBA1130]